MNAREQRGLIIAATVRLNEVHGVWVVPSATSEGKRYMVDARKGSCTCPDHAETGLKCKHVYAVEFTVKRETAADGTVTETRTLTFSEKKTYQQNWPAYDRAQAMEKQHFQELLFELCKVVPDLPKPPTGRRPHLGCDSVFSMCYKVYAGFSARRFSTDLRDAHAKGFTSVVIPGTKVCKFFEMDFFTPVLTDLVRLSALPLRGIESSFAVDSSGFSTSRHDKWFDEKFGKERSENRWVKAHVCAGVKTNVIAAARVLGKDSADSPQLPELVGETAGGFTMVEVSADKAYLGRVNANAICEVGAVPYIAIKRDTTGGVGGEFERMYHRFQMDRDSYMEHYHKRSNVESTFSMVKAKFGDAVRSRTHTAMVNEVLCKFVCHNLSCLIHAHYELGVELSVAPAKEIATAAGLIAGDFTI